MGAAGAVDSRIAAAPASPYFTSAEAAAYVRFRSVSGLRTAVMRGELSPDGVGPRSVLLFRRETLDQWIAARSARRMRRLARPGEGISHEQVSGHPSSGNEQVPHPRDGDLPHDGQAEG